MSEANEPAAFQRRHQHPHLQHDKDAGPRHEQARALMDALADVVCVLMLQALGEFFHAVTRTAKIPADEAAALVHDWMELFPVAAFRKPLHT